MLDSLKDSKSSTRELSLDRTEDYLKPFIQCKCNGTVPELERRDCRECKYEVYCRTIATRKLMGIPNPWETAWLKKKISL